MTEHRHYSGPDLAPLLRQVRDELGSDAEIIRAERIRSGGLAGFFAREHYEVVAKRQEPTASKSLEPVVGSSDTDELAGSTAAEGSGRSIQAALLDRADRVSTEELLVRVAETHSAEWGTESFQSILGRAMLDAVGPSVDKEVSPPADTVSIEERRREPSPVHVDPAPSAGTVNGLRLDSIRPGENVIDPASQPQVEGPTSQPPLDDLTSQPQVEGPVSAPAGDGGPPIWGQPWMPGWAPWMTNCWPAHAAGSASGVAPHLLCTKCADSLCAEDVDGSPAPSTLDNGSSTTRDDGDSWSDLRHEIDDVRRRLDDIVGAIRDVTGDGDRNGAREPVEGG